MASHDLHINATITSFCNVDAGIDSAASREAAEYFSTMEGAAPNLATVQKLTRSIKRELERWDKIRDDKHRYMMHEQLIDNKTKYVASKKLLAEPTPQAMTCLRRSSEGPHGKPIGSYTMNPQELDSMVIEAWSQI